MVSTKTNLVTAQDIVSSEFNNGLASLATSGAMNTKIDGSNVAEIVRASEALGETVRRTRDALGASGFSTSGNDVVRALSSDLMDNVADGAGGSLSDARFAAVWNIVSAQILLETMANELHVNGGDATQLMSNAINQISVGAANPTLEQLTVTDEMLSHAKVGLVAAYAVTGDNAIAELLTALNGVQEGSSSSAVRASALPGDYRSRLDNAVLLVAGGSPAVLETVNEVSRSGTQIISGENRAPNISGTPASFIASGSAYSFTPTASDPDGDTLSFTVSGLPSWASFNAFTGRISGTPQSNHVGTYSNISITASDGQASATLGPFAITVGAVVSNSPPQISGSAPATVSVGQNYSFTPTASDPDGDALLFMVSGLPSWARFNASMGLISGTPQSNHVGTYSNISITVSDGQANATLGPFAITVEAIVSNSPPQISGSAPADANVGQNYSFRPTASDPDGDTLSFTVSGLPSWMSFNAFTGRISGTPQSNHVGTYSNISITASDGQASATFGPFAITVGAVVSNSPPQISGSVPADVNVGQNYSFTPTASDPDGDTLSFTVSGLPSWASFNAFTGRISGTPQSNHVGTYSNISITASDGQASATFGPFAITVGAVVSNSPPQISGSVPADVNVGQNYSFTPTASDADNDNLSFTVSGLPNWASFNDTTGRISGTPQSGDVGPYSGISITVSDGQSNATLGPFTITVQAMSLGSVTLNWTAPTQNEDGTPLTDLDGYRIYWGTTPGNYPNFVTIDNESVTTYVLDNLTSGTYEFVLTSFNTSDVESGYSAPATRVVQ